MFDRIISSFLYDEFDTEYKVYFVNECLLYSKLRTFFKT